MSDHPKLLRQVAEEVSRHFYGAWPNTCLQAADAFESLEAELATKRSTGIDFLFLWMSSPNPMLGGITPLQMMYSGRGFRLANFIQEAMEDEAACALARKEMEPKT